MERYVFALLLIGCAQDPVNKESKPVVLPEVKVVGEVEEQVPEEMRLIFEKLKGIGISDQAFSHELGYFETKFRFTGDDENRAYNIKRLADILNDSPGSIVLPGEFWSFNETSGPRNEKKGFKEAPVIFFGEMVPGIGGGSCQVSSTVHAAAIKSGLDIADRRPHSRPSGYIAKGFDATVNFPPECDGVQYANAKGCDSVDLQLKNPYPFPIWMRVEVGPGVSQDGGPSLKSLIVEIHGTKPGAKITHRWWTKGHEPFLKRYRRTNKRKDAWTNRVQKGKEGVHGFLYVNRTYTDGKVSKKAYPSVYPPVKEMWEVGLGYSEDAGLPWEK